MDFLAPKYLGWLLDGWLMTLWSTLIVVIASTLLGILFAVARESRNVLLVRVTDVYISLFRNTPLLVQLFFWYFGLPALLPTDMLAWLNGIHAWTVGGVTLMRWPSFEFLAAIVGLITYSTPYVGEDIRSGLHGVPSHQRLAALALGFTHGQALRYIVLPQALRIATPPLIGQYMNILKNTSLGMAIGLAELSYRARQAEAETWKTFQVYTLTTLLYIVAILVLELVSRAAQHWQIPSRKAR